MSKIDKVKINDYFYLDNLESTINDSIRIKQICKKWSYAKNILKYSQLYYKINQSDLTKIQDYINEFKINNNYLLCARDLNDKILYISLLEEKNKNCIEIDVISNTKKQFLKELTEKDIIYIGDFYNKIFEVVFKAGKYEIITFSVHKDNFLMKKSIEHAIPYCNKFEVNCSKFKKIGDYEEYRIFKK